MARGGAREGAGRPAGSKHDTRDRRIYIRVTAREKREIERRAALAGSSVSEYGLTKMLEGQVSD